MICFPRTFHIISLILVVSCIIPVLVGLPQRESSNYLQQRIIRSKASPRIQKCGKNLMDLIQLVCEGGYPVKRSQFDDSWPSQVDRAWPRDVYLENNRRDESDLDSDFLDPKSAYSLFGSSSGSGNGNTKRSNTDNGVYFFRSIRGAADECCYKACSIDELKAYCRPT